MTVLVRTFTSLALLKTPLAHAIRKRKLLPPHQTGP